MKLSNAAFLILATAIVSSECAARTIEMVCKNQRREYAVKFIEESRRLITSASDGPIEYTVLAVEKSKNRLYVSGLTVNNGPTFRAIFAPTRKLEFFADNQLFQTDKCR
ncbi:hypothetical protein [Rhodoblastus acidophilus]|nr:hypothetical protein [Rhodoblastus acidophilus]